MLRIGLQKTIIKTKVDYGYITDCFDVDWLGVISGNMKKIYQGKELDSWFNFCRSTWQLNLDYLNSFKCFL